ncbi:MAG: 30S ribosomal protein S15 [Candidatus Marinimicrobia bacterium]|jgi:small subunit ribosomal protein S15|nr:30S ribosomal protein S15 [Candidatus Neomarinimicrobiota bacterium]MBT3797118.1 30S ribosomal protein S15 [Candidatus Neomarinimicrobiota bacterium]MBT4150112.1 30S ribosomal protein S15 [Candidatus Neomarinimicrobiota bacterium]MBT4318878.1 30S ribosomal protein S15 [Candidatus Neomarinimicrobiota bacterium]MBT5096856.1 30S ribosomal protein S15 [Candidatus Neomarinimicrobiota bacterium]
MSLENKQIKDIVKQFGKDDKDTGSSEVQIALLTARIRLLTDHAKENKKDNHSRRGLVLLVSQRKKLLKYLRRTNPESYIKLTQELSIRRN